MLPIKPAQCLSGDKKPAADLCGQHKGPVSTSQEQVSGQITQHSRISFHSRQRGRRSQRQNWASGTWTTQVSTWANTGWYCHIMMKLTWHTDSLHYRHSSNDKLNKMMTYEYKIRTDKSFGSTQTREFLSHSVWPSPLHPDCQAQFTHLCHCINTPSQPCSPASCALHQSRLQTSSCELSMLWTRSYLLHALHVKNYSC